MADTVKSAKELCRYYMDADIPTFTEGPPGVGKSQMWKQLAKERKIGFIDLRLSQMDPVDLRGLPAVQGDYSVWMRPDYWPVVKRDGPKGIILFDELADASRAMQSAAYQIILDRRAGPHVLPDGWYPCAAGNRREDKAAAQSISTALASRFAWIEIEPDVEVFNEYGLQTDMHYYVLGFLHKRPDLLFKMEGTNLKAFPSPRTWERVSKICEAPDNVRPKLVKGLVGEGAAGEFEAFVRAAVDVPDLEEIVANPKKCRIPESPSARYATAAMLSRFATRQNFGKIWQYVSRTEYGREFEICTILDATKRQPDLVEHEIFIEFANRNKDIRL